MAIRQFAAFPLIKNTACTIYTRRNILLHVMCTKGFKLNHNWVTKLSDIITSNSEFTNKRVCW